MADGKPVFTPEQQAYIDVQLKATANAAVEALKAIQPNAADSQANKTREAAERAAHDHHWRAFRTPKGVVGVAYVTQSKTHKSGRVQKFDEYILPPEEQRPKYEGRAKFHSKTGEPLPDYTAWLWDEFGCTDTNAYVGKEGALLPDLGPPRATFSDAVEDMPERHARRDEDFQCRASAADPTVQRDLIPLPAVEPRKRA